MSNLELKGGILEIIAKINDKATLEELKDLVTKFIGNHVKDTDFWDELSEQERVGLEIAIEESEDDENLLLHEEVMKKYRKWLGK
jgi:hypothetical protein